MAHHTKAPDKTGKSFGDWLVIKRDGSMKYGGAAYLCRCKCGTERRISSGSLGAGGTLSCGCDNKKTFAERSVTHGMSKHPMYLAWCRIKDRCYNRRHTYYPRYGGRGIGLCERWMDFTKFYSDNIQSWRAGLTIERIDNNGQYEPDNCRWATRAEQSRNRSNTVLMTLGDVTQPLSVWSEFVGIPQNTLRTRKRAGWSDEKALTTPHVVSSRTKRSRTCPP